MLIVVVGGLGGSCSSVMHVMVVRRLCTGVERCCKASSADCNLEKRWGEGQGMLHLGVKGGMHPVICWPKSMGGGVLRIIWGNWGSWHVG